ncbi:MAG: DUF4382 domain-containing protein [Spirochaetales bacterium]|nr:DUF4382 domain-containing protein [Spirochaetales bacterium]
MNKVERIVFAVVISLVSIMFFGCDASSGSVTINMTDAPADDLNIKEVNITVTGIGYHLGDLETEDSWVNIDFETPKEYNLLDLTGGTTEMLGEFTFPSGIITQLRFFLEAPEEPETVSGTPSNPGCYLVLEGETELDTDDVEEALFVPSGSNSGFKAVGEFEVPVNGAVTITADFDVRKSVRKTGGGMYKLQPTIRLIAEDISGDIEGTVEYTGDNVPVVFAYEDGTYNISELEADNEGLAFPEAVSSFSITDTDEDGFLDYTLAFLALGTYDLIFVELDAAGVYIADSVNIEEDVILSGETATLDFVFP